jgi:hypothetical protein
MVTIDSSNQSGWGAPCSNCGSSSSPTSGATYNSNTGTYTDAQGNIITRDQAIALGIIQNDPNSGASSNSGSITTTKATTPSATSGLTSSITAIFDQIGAKLNIPSSYVMYGIIILIVLLLKKKK